MANLRQFAIWTLAISLFVPLAGAQSYTITDLGLLPGSDGMLAYGVNDFSQVAGGASFPGTSEAFFWTKRHGLRQLKAPSGYTHLVAYALNNLGDAVGQATVPNGGHAMLWTHRGEVVDLGTPPGFTSSTAYDVNDLGVVAGWGSYGPAFIWTRGKGFHVLPTLPGSYQTVAWRINLYNHVVGFVDYADTTHAFLWTPQKGMRDLGAPAGDISEVLGNNNFGQIVGDVGPIGGVHAVLWQEDGKDVLDLGVLPGDALSLAFAVNDLGEVVGYSASSSFYDRAFVWTRDRGMEDLNNLIPTGSGWVLNTATFINLQGMICGYGAINGETHAFLLTPKK